MLTIGVLIAIVIAIGGYFFPQIQKSFGNSAGDVQNTVFSGVVAPQWFLGNNSTLGSIGEIPSTGSCNSGTYAASSTLFAVANPFSATSTATFQSVVGTGQATTSTFLVGTSTLSVGLVASNVSATFVNAGVATGTQFFTSPGISVGPGTGYLAPGTGTFRTVVVGPGEFVVGQATSTATGVGAANYTPGLTCTYKIRWTL